LRSKAEELRNVMQTVEGATDVQIEKQVLIPQVRFNIDRARAAQYGLSPGEITETLETALNGRRVSEAIEGARRYDVVVRFDDASRNSSTRCAARRLTRRRERRYRFRRSPTSSKFPVRIKFCEKTRNGELSSPPTPAGAI
jgi:Cu/Ag efflux pump CusA